MEWNSKYYAKHARLQVERAFRMLKKLPIQGSESILDLGCGSGEVTHHLATLAANGKVIGMDQSKAMIEHANHQFPDQKNLSFTIGDAAHFSYDEKFDIITSFNALHWVEDHRAILNSCKAALTPSGQIFFLMAYGRNESPFGAVTSKPKWRNRFPKLESFRDRLLELNYPKLLFESGFQIIDLHYGSEVRLFEDQKSLIDHLMTLLPSFTDLPHDENLELAMEVAASYEEYTSHPTKIEYSVPLMLVHATAT